MCVSCTSVPLLCRCLPLSLCSVIDPDKLLSELLIPWSESLMLSLRAGLTCRQHRRLPSEVTTAQAHKYTCIFMYTYVHIHTPDTSWGVDPPLGRAADYMQPPTHRYKQADFHSAVLFVRLSSWPPWRALGGRVSWMGDIWSIMGVKISQYG